MTPLRLAMLVAFVVCAALADRLAAHHSIQAQFDIHKSITISGTVAKVEWINPHSYLTLNVKTPDGKVEKWAFEMGAAAQFRQNGLSRADRGGMKAGDAVTVIALASRDGSNSGLVQELKMADGRVFRLRPEPGQER